MKNRPGGMNACKNRTIVLQLRHQSGGPMTGQTSPPKRRRGGQPGNISGLKHGLFSRRINPADLYHLGVNQGYASNQQIAQVRLYIRDLFDHAAQVDDLSENLVLPDHIAVAAGVLASILYKR